MTEPALFTAADVPDGPVGLSEKSMRDQIEAWQRSGRAISAVVRRTLLDQAQAIDMARASHRATAITGACTSMVLLLREFRLIDDAPPPADDPFEALMASLAGNDDTG